MIILFSLFTYVAIGNSKIIEGEPLLDYELDIKTSSRRYAGTRDNVGIRLTGWNDTDFANTNFHWFSGRKKKLFRTGAIDHIRMNTRDIGDLQKITVMIFHENRIRTDAWSVDWIRLRYRGFEFKAYFYKTLRSKRQTENSYAITIDGCPSGYDHVMGPTRQYCKDRDECKYTCMEKYSKCTNYDGGYTCTCMKGYERVGEICQDVNECYYPENTECEKIPHATCVNTEGSYKCDCKEGFQTIYINGTMHCQDINECDSKELNICQHNCRNTNGSFFCYCQRGFKLAPDKVTCIEANECIHNTCNMTTSTCYATGGTYHCLCKEGYMHQNENFKTCLPRRCNSLIVDDGQVIVKPKSCLIAGAMHFGNICEFTCQNGYRLHEKSSREFKCNEDGVWKPISELVEKADRSGREPIRSFTPRCVPTFCKPLPEIRHGYIVPLSCTRTGIQHGGTCNYYCNRGYKLLGSPQVNCNAEKFDSKFIKPHCVKVPEIHCPDDVILSLPIDSNRTTLGSKYKGAVTNMPEANIRSEPSQLSPETEFEMGTTIVHVFAFNYVGDEAECQYRVTVKDTSAPVITFCPEDKYMKLKEAKDVMVDWEEPVFHDNTGIKEIRKSQPNKQMHPPISFNVVYDAIDQYNNVATCAFTVNMKVPTCSFDNIEGGVGAINKFCVMMAGKKAFCNAQCPGGKTFSNIPITQGALRNAWWCTGGKWSGINRVPDCVDFSSVPEEEKQCPEGMIRTLDYRNSKPIRVCGKCPKGTHYVNFTTNGRPSCEPCPINTYQDEEGKTFCKSCRHGFGTWRERRISSEDCEGLCPPGFRSRTGFVDLRAGGCIPCPKNTFNSKFGQRHCYPCPPGYITENVGASVKMDCKPLPTNLVAFPSPEIEMFEGSSFYFDCLSYSIPPPKFTWSVRRIGIGTSDRHFKEEIQNERGFLVSRYTIIDVTAGDTGYYNCIAYYGETKKEALTVQVKVIPTGITGISNQLP